MKLTGDVTGILTSIKVPSQHPIISAPINVVVVDGVIVGVGVDVLVGVKKGVLLTVGVTVGVLVTVGLGIKFLVAVTVGVGVGVGDNPGVGVTVGVTVGVGVAGIGHGLAATQVEQLGYKV